MFNISSYLEKFKNFGQSERQQKENVVLAIKEIAGITLETNVVSIRNGEVNVKVSPGVRSAIYVKKVLILERIKEKGGKNIIDLRWSLFLFPRD